jgi:hypothetical protein
MMTPKQKRERKTVIILFTKLMKNPLQTFPPLWGELIAPKKKGVYVIHDPSGIVVHVGRTPRAKEGMHRRLRAHMSGNSSFTHKHLKKDGSKLRSKYQFRCIVVDDSRHRALLEAYAAGQLCPEHFGLGEGI